MAKKKGLTKDQKEDIIFWGKVILIAIVVILFTVKGLSDMSTENIDQICKEMNEAIVDCWVNNPVINDAILEKCINQYVYNTMDKHGLGKRTVISISYSCPEPTENESRYYHQLAIKKGLIS